MVLFGNLNSYLNDEKVRSSHFLDNFANFKYLKGEVVDHREGQTTHRYYVRLQKGSVDDSWKNLSGKVVIISRGAATAKVGDEVVFANTLSEIKPPKTPFDVNFKKIYSNQGIFLQQFMDSNDEWLLLGNRRGFLESLADDVNRNLKALFRQKLSDKSYAVAAALLLGDKSYLDDDTRNTFAKSGLMHVLAVSGLHVGILFLLVHYAFGFVKVWRYGKIYFLVIVLLILWSYALVTGLSSSVVRASVMFSIFSFGPLLGMRTVALNTTAFAAFVILLFSPNALFQIGFQLSFVAVFSILFFYHDVYRLIAPRTAVGDTLWKMSSVSIAVQIGTLPLVVYYFHHIQPLFLLYNLLAAPFAFAGLSLGFLYLLLSGVPLLADALAYLLDRLIVWSTALIDEILRHSPDLGYVEISFAQLICVYLFIALVCIFLVQKRMQYMVLGVLVAGIFSGLTIYKWSCQMHQQEIIVTQQGPEYRLDIISGKNALTLGNVKSENTDLLRKAEQKCKVLGITGVADRKKAAVKRTDEYEMWVWAGKSVLIIKNADVQLPLNLKVDCLVLETRTSYRRRQYFQSFAKRLVSLRAN